MGIDLHLYRDDKHVATLGRAHSYTTDVTSEEMLIAILRSIVKIEATDTMEDVDDELNTLEELVGEIMTIGRASVIEELEEEGIEIRRE